MHGEHVPLQEVDQPLFDMDNVSLFTDLEQDIPLLTSEQLTAICQVGGNAAVNAVTGYRMTLEELQGDA